MPRKGAGQTLRLGRGTGGRPAPLPGGRADPGAAGGAAGARLALVPAQPGGGGIAGRGGRGAAPGRNDGGVLRLPGGRERRRGAAQRGRGPDERRRRTGGARRGRTTGETGQDRGRREGETTAGGAGGDAPRQTHAADDATAAGRLRLRKRPGAGPAVAPRPRDLPDGVPRFRLGPVRPLVPARTAHHRRPTGQDQPFGL